VRATQTRSPRATPRRRDRRRLVSPGILGRLLDAALTELAFRFRRRFYRQRMEAVRDLPRNLHIEGTNVCNASCVFCAYPQMQRPKLEMPMTDFRRIVDEYVAMGGRGVSLTPIVGDPFVDRRLFERLDYLASKPELRGFYFYTNAILMRPQLHSRILEYDARLHIHVSLGGFDRETYREMMGVDQFEIVRRNLRAFIEAKLDSGSEVGLTFHLRCPDAALAGDFWEECLEWQEAGLVRLLGTRAFDSWAGKVGSAELAEAGLRRMARPYKRGACQLLFFKPVVLADGRVNACACRDVEAELIVGDLTESSLSEVWRGGRIAELIERHERGDFPDVCRRCSWYASIYNPRMHLARANRAAFAWYDD
jgi:radical SAM protein with 4Fe4S-binding SPASM domain